MDADRRAGRGNGRRVVVAGLALEAAGAVSASGSDGATGAAAGQNAEMSIPSRVMPSKPTAVFFHHSGSVSKVSGAAGTSAPHFEQKAAPC